MRTGTDDDADRRRWRAGERGSREGGRRQQILHALRVAPGLSKVQLARRLRMSPATAGVLVEELQQAGVIVARGRNHATGGRPSERLALNDREPWLLAVHIGRGGVSMGVLTLDGGLAHRDRAPFRWSGPSAEVEGVVEAVHAFLAGLGRPVAGIGVAAPGLVDVDRGVVTYSANLGWYDVPLRRMLAATLDVPVTMDRNTAVTLVAEDWWGATGSADPVVFATLGLEIGTSIRAGGSTVRGASGGAGELGHIPMDPDGPRCGCGRRGCLEALASSVALRRRYRELDGGASGEDLQVADIETAARGGEEPARRALAEVGRHLGTGMATLVNLLNPELIVLGGELMEAQDTLLPVIRSAVASQALPQLAEAVEIRHSTFGNDAPLVGAGTMALDALFRSLD